MDKIEAKLVADVSNVVQGQRFIHSGWQYCCIQNHLGGPVLNNFVM